MQVWLLHVHKLEVPLLIVDQVNKWPLGILPPYKVVKLNVLADSGLFTHQADTEEQYSFEFVFLATCKCPRPIFTLLLALVWSPPTPKGSLSAKCSTMFTS